MSKIQQIAVMQDVLTQLSSANLPLCPFDSGSRAHPLWFKFMAFCTEEFNINSEDVQLSAEIDKDITIALENQRKLLGFNSGPSFDPCERRKALAKFLGVDPSSLSPSVTNCFWWGLANQYMVIKATRELIPELFKWDDFGVVISDGVEFSIYKVG